MRAYSLDLRQRIVGAVVSGSTQRQVSQQFGVSLSTVNRLVRQHRQSGHVEPKRSKPGPKLWVDDEAAPALLLLVVQRPDATLSELSALWHEQSGNSHPPLSRAALSRTLRRLGLTRKKRR